MHLEILKEVFQLFCEKKFLIPSMIVRPVPGYFVRASNESINGFGKIVPLQVLKDVG